MKIMIVEDHEGMRKMLKRIVDLTLDHDIAFIECSRGEEALQEYGHHYPDYVLMDLQLKEMNGFNVVEKIYEQDPNAKVIIVTSHNLPAFKRRAKELNAVGFIVKEELSDLKDLLKTLPM